MIVTVTRPVASSCVDVAQDAQLLDGDHPDLRVHHGGQRRHEGSPSSPPGGRGAAPASRRADRTGARCAGPRGRRSGASRRSGGSASPRRSTGHGDQPVHCGSSGVAAVPRRPRPALRPAASASNSSCVYGQTSSTAACIRRCDSSVPSPSRTVHSDAWSRWYADSLRALAAIAAQPLVGRGHQPLVDAAAGRRARKSSFAIVTPKSPGAPGAAAGPALGSSTSRQLRNSWSSRRKASSSSSPEPPA